MHFTPSIAAAILALTPVAMAASQTVQVGQNNGLTFRPNTVTMNVGDQLVFQFDNANHTATMGNINAPCVANNQGFSGYMPVNNNQPTPVGANPPGRNRFMRDVDNIFETRQNNGAATYTYTQTTAGTQVWYCSAAAHCQNGMSMVVNVVNGGANKRQSSNNLKQTLAGYQRASRKVQNNGQAQVPAGTGGTLSPAAVKIQQKNGGTGGGQAAQSGRGRNGANGANGANGRNGANGANGANGRNGGKI